MSASNYKIPKYSNLASFNPSPVRRLQPYYSRITYHSFVGKEIKYSEDTVKALKAFKIVPEKINELKKGEEILDMKCVGKYSNIYYSKLDLLSSKWRMDVKVYNYYVLSFIMFISC